MSAVRSCQGLSGYAPDVSDPLPPFTDADQVALELVEAAAYLR
jgi:hypothetical protein